MQLFVLGQVLYNRINFCIFYDYHGDFFESLLATKCSLNANPAPAKSKPSRISMQSSKCECSEKNRDLCSSNSGKRSIFIQEICFLMIYILSIPNGNAISWHQFKAHSFFHNILFSLSTSLFFLMSEFLIPDLKINRVLRKLCKIG